MKKGCIDEVAPREVLLEKALEVAQRFMSGELNLQDRMTRGQKDRLPDSVMKKMIITYAKDEAAKKGKGYIAPFKAIEAIERGLSDDFEADLKIEAELFSDCAVSDVAKNLIAIFLNTRAAGKLPRTKGMEPQKVKTVAMLGGGAMGSGITNLLLSNGFETILWDINDEAIQKGLSAIRKTFAYPIKIGKMTQEDLDRKIRDHLTTTTVLDDLKRADLIIEAVLEDMKIKQGIWKNLEEICRPEVIFASNTSALPITEMASVLKDPGRMIGLHFFNPAERMQLLEIICGKKTSDVSLATSVAFARAIRKVPIVVNDGPGFYVSRQLGGLLGESTFLIGEGVDAALVEEAVVDFGLPMGPATLGDLTGIDINYHVIRNFERSLGERWKTSPIYEVVYQTGRSQPQSSRSHQEIFEGEKDPTQKGFSQGDRRPDARPGHQRGCLYDPGGNLRQASRHGLGDDLRNRVSSIPRRHPPLRRYLGNTQCLRSSLEIGKGAWSPI
jgi:3-hydroxyacyl-CoA dehydrogenase